MHPNNSCIAYSTDISSVMAFNFLLSHIQRRLFKPASIASAAMIPNASAANCCFILMKALRTNAWAHRRPSMHSHLIVAPLVGIREQYHLQPATPCPRRVCCCLLESRIFLGSRRPYPITIPLSSLVAGRLSSFLRSLA